jgi:hypothetical protein
MLVAVVEQVMLVVQAVRAVRVVVAQEHLTQEMVHLELQT